MKYWQTIGEVELEDLVFFDEAGDNIAMTRRHAWSEKGKRAYGKAPADKGKNVTMVGGLSIHGFLAPMTWQGGTDGTIFLAYKEKKHVNYGTNVRKTFRYGSLY